MVASYLIHTIKTGLRFHEDGFCSKNINHQESTNPRKHRSSSSLSSVMETINDYILPFCWLAFHVRWALFPYQHICKKVELQILDSWKPLSTARTTITQPKGYRAFTTGTSKRNTSSRCGFHKDDIILWSDVRDLILKISMFQYCPNEWSLFIDSHKRSVSFSQWK